VETCGYTVKPHGYAVRATVLWVSPHSYPTRSPCCTGASNGSPPGSQGLHHGSWGITLPLAESARGQGNGGGLAINAREGSTPTGSTHYPPDEQLLAAVGGGHRGEPCEGGGSRGRSCLERNKKQRGRGWGDDRCQIGSSGRRGTSHPGSRMKECVWGGACSHRERRD
jgi:hypothetical protein